MTIELDDERRRLLVIHATTSYADSCTLPNLTPSCPFFERQNGVATCGEQCRAVVTELGGIDRPVTSHSLNGITMIGREIPIAVVAGSSEFDAAQLYLTERDFPLDKQSTSCLLMSLRTVIARDILANPTESSYSALEIWGELSRRGIDMDRVAPAGLVQSIASAIALRTIVDQLTQSAAPEGMEIELSAWTHVLASAFAAHQQDPSDPSDMGNAVGFSLAELLAAMGSTQTTEEFTRNHPEAEYALTRSFLDRVSEWLIHRIHDDLEGALSVTAPQPELFNAIQPTIPADEAGRWIWERFTRTEFDSWGRTSLLLEWKWAALGESSICGPLVLNERTIPADVVGDLALREYSEARGRMAPAAGLTAGMFVAAATRLLLEGKWSEATRIFAGLVDLQPGDAEAWNNQGFCELAGNPATALALLSRAELLAPTPKVVYIANQALALHLLNRDAEALEACERASTLGVEGDGGAYLWAHPTELGELELVDDLTPDQYVQSLALHIRASDCTTR